MGAVFSSCGSAPLRRKGKDSAAPVEKPANGEATTPVAEEAAPEKVEVTITTDVAVEEELKADEKKMAEIEASDAEITANVPEVKAEVEAEIKAAEPEVSVEAEALSSTEGVAEAEAAKPSAAASFMKNIDIRKSLRAAKKSITKPFKNLRKQPAAEGVEGEAAAEGAAEGVLGQAAAAVEAGVDSAADAAIEVVATKVEEVAAAGVEKVEGIFGGISGGTEETQVQVAAVSSTVETVETTAASVVAAVEDVKVEAEVPAVKVELPTVEVVTEATPEEVVAEAANAPIEVDVPALAAEVEVVTETTETAVTETADAELIVNGDGAVCNGEASVEAPNVVTGDAPASIEVAVKTVESVIASSVEIAADRTES